MTRWVLHDLRRTGDTIMNEELDIDPHVVEAILNHVSGDKSGKDGVADVALGLLRGIVGKDLRQGDRRLCVSSGAERFASHRPDNSIAAAADGSAGVLLRRRHH
jgi:hypothetical protein